MTESGRARPLRGVCAAALVAAALVAVSASPAEAIIGGRPVPPRQLKAAARVVVAGAECSGTLLSPRHVILALHCVQAEEGGDAAIGVGAKVTVGNPNRGGLVQERRVVGVVAAPQPDPPPAVTGQVDAAILVLDRAVDVPPSSVAPPAEAPGLVAVGAPLVLAGFGATTVPPPEGLAVGSSLIEGSVQVAACADIAAGNDDSGYVGCAAPTATPQLADIPVASPCVGDSGGPVLAPSPSLRELVLVGVLSGGAGEGDCDPANGAIFTTIASLLSWINDVEAMAAPPEPKPPRGCASQRRALKRFGHKIAVVRRELRHRRHSKRLRARLRGLRRGHARLHAAIYRTC